MIYKINFKITLLKERPWQQVKQKITSLAEDYVLTENKDSLNFIMNTLSENHIIFSVEELNSDDTKKKL
jgi:hypothetical protein